MRQVHKPGSFYVLFVSIMLANTNSVSCYWVACQLLITIQGTGPLTDAEEQGGPAGGRNQNLDIWLAQRPLNWIQKLHHSKWRNSKHLLPAFDSPFGG